MSPGSEVQYRYGLARNGEWESASVKIVTALSGLTDLLRKSKISARCRLTNCDGYTPVLKCAGMEGNIYPFVMEILHSKKITAPKLHDLIIEVLTEVYPAEEGISPMDTGISFMFRDEETGVSHRVDMAIVQYDGEKTVYLAHDPKKGRYSYRSEEMSAFDLSEMNTLKKYYRENTRQLVIGEFGRLLNESTEDVTDTLACYDQAARNIMNRMLNDPNFDPNKLAYSDDDPENNGPVY